MITTRTLNSTTFTDGTMPPVSGQTLDTPPLTLSIPHTTAAILSQVSGQDLTANMQAYYTRTNIAVVVLASFFVGLRYLSRWTAGAGIGVDDCLVAVALLIVFCLLATGQVMIHDGLGMHANALEFEKLVSVGKGLLAFECIYVTAVAATKLSLLCMYYRIFKVRRMKVSCCILGGLTIAWCLAIVMVCIFQCTPIAKGWNPTIPGHCIDLKGSFIGNAVPNILTDVAILTLPMPHVWGLQTTLTQRFQLSFIFLLGSFVIFTSIYRFTTLFDFETSDLTWTLAKACTWCIIECSAGIISACLPTLAPLLKNLRSLVSENEGSPRDCSELVTIGGSNGKRSRGSKRLDSMLAREEEVGIFQTSDGRHMSGVFYATKESKDEAADGSLMTAADGSFISGDEIPLKGFLG